MSIEENTNLTPGYSQAFYYKKFIKSIGSLIDKKKEDTQAGKKSPLFDIKYSIKAPQLTTKWESDVKPKRSPMIFPDAPKQTNAASYGHGLSTAPQKNHTVFSAVSGSLQMVDKDKYTRTYGETHDNLTVIAGCTSKSDSSLVEKETDHNLIAASTPETAEQQPKKSSYNADWAAKAILSNSESTTLTNTGITDYTSTKIGLGSTLQFDSNLTNTTRLASTLNVGFGAIQESSSIGDNTFKSSGKYADTSYKASFEQDTFGYGAHRGTLYAKSTGTYNTTSQTTDWSTAQSAGYTISNNSRPNKGIYAVTPSVYYEKNNNQNLGYTRYTTNKGFELDASYQYKGEGWGVSLDANARAQQVHTEGSFTHPINETRSGLGYSAQVSGYYNISHDVRFAASYGRTSNMGKGVMDYASAEISAKIQEDIRAYAAADWAKSERGECLTARVGADWQCTKDSAIGVYYSPSSKEDKNRHGSFGVDYELRF